MNHHASRKFWQCYEALPSEVQRLADANYQLLKSDEMHPSLQFKTVGRFRSVRVGLHYRALGISDGDNVVWFWIGHHAEYDKLIVRR